MSFCGIVECCKTAEGVYGAWEVQESLYVGMYKFMQLPKSAFEKSYQVFITWAV